MEHLGKYIYCIIRCPEERTFEDVAAIGETDGPVYTVPEGGLAAVVSDSAAMDYESTRANMLAHEGVQERVMRDFTLLPVRFGTVADPAASTRRVQTLLQKRAQEFDGLLAEMDGKVELGLKVLWRDENLLFQELLAQSGPIRKLRDGLQRQPPEATQFERIRLGEMVKNALDGVRDAQAAKLLAPLRRIACRVVENSIVIDRMVVNAAFLVDKAREAEFDRAVDRLHDGLRDRVVVKYVGGVPPYNFVNIVVNWQDS